MGNPCPTRLPAPRLLITSALIVFAVAVGTASALAGVLSPDEPPQAKLSTTGDDSELLDAVPISKQPGTRERVVMSLGPDQLEEIAGGDRIRVSGEVQVSTTCVTEGPRCVGRQYEVNPSVTTRIVLADGSGIGAASFALSGTTKKLCKQRRPNRNHHCTLAVPNIDTSIPDLAELPCPSDGCYVNMILGAANKKAKPGDKVVLGADQPDGSVLKDKGRLNVVQAPPSVAAPATSSSGELVNASVPLTEGKDEKRRVVYSVPISAPKKGEVITFDSTFLAGISRLRFNTFIGSRTIIADSPTSTETSGPARKAALFKGAASESNGFNCTLGPSGYSNPCTVVKAGATRITRDAVDDLGQPVTLYVNVVAAAKPLLAEKVEGSPQITLGQGSGLTVHRYTPPPGAAR